MTSKKHTLPFSRLLSPKFAATHRRVIKLFITLVTCTKAGASQCVSLCPKLTKIIFHLKKFSGVIPSDLHLKGNGNYDGEKGRERVDGRGRKGGKGRKTCELMKAAGSN